MKLRNVANLKMADSHYTRHSLVAYTRYAYFLAVFLAEKILSTLAKDSRSTQTTFPLTGSQLQQIWPKEKEWKTKAREHQKQMILVYIQISQTPPKQQEQPLVLPDSESYASIASNQQLFAETN